ncbi:hypothetical protein Pla100_03750 [Neorhodopirellula pilleata]|uniref:Uncharacterized protein n=1 Tax=Neorhodopirellula pilleata TaxID=2714738 RepID=A0A5C6AV20_9BACT|nr:hypothetical protein Pla100_03750 [Neorhodopirellula pilleata]
MSRDYFLTQVRVCVAMALIFLLIGYWIYASHLRTKNVSVPELLRKSESIVMERENWTSFEIDPEVDVLADGYEVYAHRVPRRPGSHRILSYDLEGELTNYSRGR